MSGFFAVCDSLLSVTSLPMSAAPLLGLTRRAEGAVAIMVMAPIIVAAVITVIMMTVIIIAAVITIMAMAVIIIAAVITIMAMVVIVIAIVVVTMVTAIAIIDPDMGIVHAEICAVNPYRTTAAGGEQCSQQDHQNPLVHNNLLWFP